MYAWVCTSFSFRCHDILNYWNSYTSIPVTFYIYVCHYKHAVPIASRLNYLKIVSNVWVWHAFHLDTMIQIIGIAIQVYPSLFILMYVIKNMLFL